MKLLTYDSFIETYKPIKNKFVDDAPFDGCMFETYGDELEELKNHDIQNIWTIVDSDVGLIIIAGYHYVDRYGYFITEKQWEDENIEVVLEED